MRRNRPASPQSRTFASWWNRSPLVISTTSKSAAIASTASRTPGSSSTGCRSRSLPRPTMRCRSVAAMRASVSSTAASIIDSTAFDAIAEHRDVAAFDLVQALVRACIGQVDVTAQDALELELGGVEEILAAPEGVVGIEAD